MDKKFTDKLRAYNISVTNKVTKWQQDYERRNGPLGANLAGRIAWAIRPDAKGKVPRPFLTNTFITALDTMFEQISSFIREVHLFHIDCLPLLPMHRPWTMRGQFDSTLTPVHPRNVSV